MFKMILLALAMVSSVGCQTTPAYRTKTTVYYERPDNKDGVLGAKLEISYP